METVYDVQQLLRRFGAFIYTGNRHSDLTMMELEVADLKNNGLIDTKTYQTAILILRKAVRQQ